MGAAAGVNGRAIFLGAIFQRGAVTLSPAGTFKTYGALRIAGLRFRVGLFDQCQISYAGGGVFESRRQQNWETNYDNLIPPRLGWPTGRDNV